MESKLAQRLKELREEKGLSQIELAKQLQLGSGFIGNIEAGRKSISIETLILLTKFFHCSAGYLIGTED